MAPPDLLSCELRDAPLDRSAELGEDRREIADADMGDAHQRRSTGRSQYKSLVRRIVPGFLRSAILLVVAAAVSRGAATLAGVFVARTVSPADFGRLTLMQATVTFLAGVGGLGLGVAVTRQVAATRIQDRPSAGAYLGMALAVTAGAASLLCVLWVVSRHVVAAQLLRSPGAQDVVLVSTATILFSALASCLQSGLLGLEAFRSLALAQVVQGIAVGTGLVTGAAVADLPGALLGLTAGNAVAALAAWRLLRREIRARSISLTLHRAAQGWRPLWRLALPGLAASVVLYVGLLYGQVLLSRQPHGLDDLAVFNLAYRWHLAIVFIPAAVAPALLPMMTRLLANSGDDEARRLFRLNLALSAGLVVVLACVVVLGAHQLLGLSGSFYAHRTTPLLILAAAALPTALNNVLSGASLSVGRVRAWVLSDLAFAAALIGTAVLLVHEYRATGLAFAYLAGYGATVAVLGVALLHRPPVARVAQRAP
jgi:O-antigen/teichoic acid export membrane protein